MIAVLLAAAMFMPPALPTAPLLPPADTRRYRGRRYSSNEVDPTGA